MLRLEDLTGQEGMEKRVGAAGGVPLDFHSPSFLSPRHYLHPIYTAPYRTLTNSPLLLPGFVPLAFVAFPLDPGSQIQSSESTTPRLLSTNQLCSQEQYFRLRVSLPVDALILPATPL